MAKNLIIPAILVAFAAGLASEACAQSRTGSQSQPVNRLWFGKPSELDRIGHLVETGATAEAVEVAQSFAQSMHNGIYQYDALNALCVAYSANKQYSDAVATCDQAVDLRPSRWVAYNSRGTAKFMIGNYEAAIEDYSQALRRAPNSTTVRFNLSLARQRLRPE